jgi:hypothetical protein
MSMRLVVVHPLVVRGDPLEDHDADRLINQGAPAGRLAGMGTDPAADRRNRHVLSNRGQGQVEAVVLDPLDVGGNVDVRRALVHAGGGELFLVGAGGDRFAFFADVGQVIVPEMFHGIEDRDGGGHAQGALAVLHELRQALDDRQVPFLPVALDDACQGVLEHLGPFLAGRALGAAVLFLDTLHVFGGHGDDVGFGVHHDHAVPAHEGADFSFAQVILGKFELEGCQVRLASPAVVDDVPSPT